MSRSRVTDLQMHRAGHHVPTMASARFQFFTRRMATVEWRLISSNNWELGRCPAPVGSLEACVAAVLDLRATVDGFAQEVLPDGRGSWGWRLLREADVVAVASHSFVRRVECERTLAQFRTLARDAPLVATLRVFPPHSSTDFVT